MTAPGVSRCLPLALVLRLCLLQGTPTEAGGAASAAAPCVPSQPQSPIDVDRNRVVRSGEESFLTKASWKPAAGLQLSNKGTHIAIESNQLGYVTLGGSTGFPKYYEVASVLLKMPSEHLIGGRQFAAELQVFHKNQVSVLELDGQDVLATSFMFDLGEESKLLNLLLPEPLPVSGASTIISRPVDLMWGLGPALDASFFKYNGSYVAQGCGEKVQWVIFDRPMTLSQTQQQTFQAAVRTQAQAVQPLGMRSLALNTMEEGRLAGYRFFVTRDVAYNPERTNPHMIFAPVVGTIVLCIAVMCSIFVREDPHRKQSSAGGLSIAKAGPEEAQARLADAC